MLQIGADETVELGKGQTKQEVDARGLGPVYLDYMQRVVTELKPLNRKLLYWGDIAMDDWRDDWATGWAWAAGGGGEWKAGSEG